MPKDLVESLKSIPLIGVMRGHSSELTVSAVEAAARGGLCAVEISLTSPQAFQTISDCKKRAPTLCTGAGTVLSIDDLEKALDAGADFIMTPCVDSTILELANKKSVPIVCGASTPTEIYKAWKEGASLIKLFPNPGAKVLLELKAPFPHIPLCPMGGVNKTNIREFFYNGAAAVGVGSAIFHEASVKDFDDIESRAKELVNAYNDIK